MEDLVISTYHFMKVNGYLLSMEDEYLGKTMVGKVKQNLYYFITNNEISVIIEYMGNFIDAVSSIDGIIRKIKIENKDKFLEFIELFCNGDAKEVENLFEKEGELLYQY